MPHALRIESGRVVGSDPSRAERADGTAGEGWVWCTPFEFADAMEMDGPRWDNGAVREATAAELAAEKAAADAAYAASPEGLAATARAAAVAGLVAVFKAIGLSQRPSFEAMEGLAGQVAPDTAQKVRDLAIRLANNGGNYYRDVPETF